MTNSSKLPTLTSKNMEIKMTDITHGDNTLLRSQTVTRYIMPLREGGSLPALAEADDDFKYVVKFRGAGHGPKALVAELIGGEIARAAGMRVPELVFLSVGEDFGRTEGDEEIQDLLKASLGLNLGLHFLSGAMTFDPVVNDVDEATASRIVWLDAYLTNVDRTVRNTNMLVWNRELWLIDHGATLYFHHSWRDLDKAPLTPFAYIRDHALLRRASRLEEADAEMRRLLTDEVIDRIVDAVPAEWLVYDEAGRNAGEAREVYRSFLKTRRDNSHIFLKQAVDARKTLI